MFAKRFFPGRMFAPHYWPSQTVLPVAEPGEVFAARDPGRLFLGRDPGRVWRQT